MVAGIQVQQKIKLHTFKKSLQVSRLLMSHLPKLAMWSRPESEWRATPQGMARWRKTIVPTFTIYLSVPGRDIGKPKGTMIVFLVIKIIKIIYWHISGA